VSAKPIIAVTLGDVAGVGPEVVVRAWLDPDIHRRCRLVAIGHPRILQRAVELIGSLRPDQVMPTVVPVGTPDQLISSVTTLPCLAVGSDELLEVAPASIDARSGQGAYDAVVAAVDLARRGEVDAMTTAPLSKAALWKAGKRYPGHTELLAQRCGVDAFAMMLYLPPGEVVAGPAGLGVVHVTLHIALRDVFSQLTVDNVLEKCRLADAVMRRLLDRPPRVGVCALNPHAGEDGLFGDEEQRIISPAVELGRREGIELSGPLPADTIMLAARNGAFDAVVAMVHDQGHIALKLLGMHRAVNVTLGLPIVRTSVAHGTAWDLAWQGKAESTGMIAALQVAARLTREKA